MAERPRRVTPPIRPGWFRRAYASASAGAGARWLSRTVSWRLDPILLRLTGGRLCSTLVFRSEVLQTTGARSGKRRTNVVIYFHDGDRIVVVASNAGAAKHPAWFHNAVANPEVVLGGRPMTASVVTGEPDRSRLEELADRVYPAYVPYRRRAAAEGRSVPIVALVPAG